MGERLFIPSVGKPQTALYQVRELRADARAEFAVATFVRAGAFVFVDEEGRGRERFPSQRRVNRVGGNACRQFFARGAESREPSSPR